MGEFVFTQHLVDVSNQLWFYSSAISAGLCSAILLVICILSLHRPSRRYLDRVSFRIVCYSLAANTACAIANAVGGSFTGPTPACGFTIWILQLTLQLSSLLNFCIALNMQMVIVLGIDGRRAEKYYILGSALLGLGITVPAYAAKQYGWDHLVQDCWYANDNQTQRLAWQIGTQLFWTGAAVVGEVVCSVVLLAFLWKHVMRRKRIVRTVNSIANDTGVRSSPAVAFKGRLGSGSIDRQIDNVKAYKGVIIRIALYPLISCIINLTSIMCVLHASLTNGVHSRTDYNILLLSDFLYGGRGGVYTLLAASDPALVRAVKCFLTQFFPARSTLSTSTSPSLSFAPRTSMAPPLDSAIIHIGMDKIGNTDTVGTYEAESEDMGKTPDFPDQVSVVDRKPAPPLGRWGDRTRSDEVVLTTVLMERERTSLELEREAFERQI